jgi:phosphodiesterase/alkaline phosphatase D-like protein
VTGESTPSEWPAARQRREVLVLGVLVLAASVTTALAVFADTGVDEPLARDVRGLDLPAAGLLADADHPVVLAVTAVLLTLLVAASRCRALVAVTAGVAAVAAVAAWSLPWLADHARLVRWPDGGPVAYPAPALLALTLVAGLVLVAVGAVAGRPAARRICAAALGTVLVAVSVGDVHAGTARPLEVAGAVLLGALLAVVADLLLERASWHARCGACAWRRRAAAARAVEPVAIELDVSRTRRVHRAAGLWTLALLVAFAVHTWTRGLPRTPESGVMGTRVEVPLEWSLLAVVASGVALALRWHVAGAVVGAAGATLLGYASAMLYLPPVAAAVAVAVWVPALLLWLEWHRRATPRAVLAAVAVTSLVVSGVVATAATTYDRYWGPTHPRSTTQAPDTRSVRWMWAGAVTPTGAEVRLRTARRAGAVRLRVSARPDLSAPVVVAAEPRGGRVLGARLTGLQPDRRYWYAAEVDGELVSRRVQSFRTFPAPGPASFSFAVGACQLGGSNGRVFDAIRATDPLFFLVTGDWTYANIGRDDPGRFRTQYDLNLTAPAQAALYARAPSVYVWDDHDFGSNDADGTSPSRPAATNVYRQLAPHYPPVGAGSSIHQAFTVGRVRFVVLDTRSARDPAGRPSGAFRSTLGAAQRQWLLAELAAASRYALVVLVSPDPWIDAADPSGDSWGGFPEERRIVADAIARHASGRLLMLAGDAHMLGFDDGSHTNYATSAAAAAEGTTQSGAVRGFPLFHAAALDRPGEAKGGPYSGPVMPGAGQFGTVAVDDDGTDVTVTLTGLAWDSRTLLTRTLRFAG